jgi:hypothetical protein
MKKELLKVSGLMLFIFACVVSLQAQSSDERRPIVGRPIYANFDVEVLVNGYALNNLYGRGRRYVEAIEGAEYELRIRNPLNRRVAVALFVDGLNTIDAKRTSAERATKWVIEPYGSITISGWQVSDSRARRFYFTTERDSYAAKIGQPADFGAITAVFFREKERYIVKPLPRIYKDDDLTREDKSQSGTQNRESNKAKTAESGACCPPPRRDEKAATGIGRNVQHDVEWIDVKLEERPTASVTIRYEYRDALVRLGIIPRREQPVVKQRNEDARRYAPEP